MSEHNINLICPLVQMIRHQRSVKNPLQYDTKREKFLMHRILQELSKNKCLSCPREIQTIVYTATATVNEALGCKQDAGQTLGYTQWAGPHGLLYGLSCFFCDLPTQILKCFSTPNQQFFWGGLSVCTELYMYI